MKICLSYQEKNLLINAIRGFLARAWCKLRDNTSTPQNKQNLKENYYFYRDLFNKLLHYDPNGAALSLNKKEMDYLFSAAFCTGNLSEETRQRVLAKTNYSALLANLHYFNC